MKSFSDVVIKTNVVDYLNSISEPTILVYSPLSAEKIDLFDCVKNDYIRFISSHDVSKNVEKIDTYINSNNDVSCVVGFGGGTAIDIAKYMANEINIKIVAIPSMLSTNVYSTDKVLMFKGGKKYTLDSKMPELIVFDEQLLKMSLEENLFGFGDVLTIYTASKDWLISCQQNNEKLDDMIFKMDMDLLDNTVDYILNNTYEDIVNDLFQMFIFIGTVGHITNIYGSGRPVSGSEHIFAKELESVILVPHGLAVAIGILIMSLYQDNYSFDIEKCFKKLKLFDYVSKFGITKDIVKSVLFDLEPRVDRYSIVNTFDRFDKNIEKKIDDVLMEFNIL